MPTIIQNVKSLRKEKQKLQMLQGLIHNLISRYHREKLSPTLTTDELWRDLQGIITARNDSQRRYEFLTKVVNTYRDLSWKEIWSKTSSMDETKLFYKILAEV